MRDLVLFLGMLFYLPVSMIAPAAGLIIWEWFGLMSPQRLVYGFGYGLPFERAIVVVTLLGWLFSRERKRFTPDALPWLLLAFFAWATFNMVVAAPYPAYSWRYWNQAMRAFVPVFLAFVLMTRKARIHGLIWMIVVSLGFYGVKGGVYTIVHLGHGRVFGPPGSQITDNNALALSLVMELPLVYYLWRHTEHRLLRFGLQAAAVLQAISILGSYSRGAFISIAVMLGLFWWRSKNKLVYAIVGTVVMAAILSIMPGTFWERMSTLHDISASSSFEGRVQAWHVAFMYANDHFPFGAGFQATALAPIFHHYLPGAVLHVAHSIYFEVLGDNGYPGLILYLLALAFSLRNARIVVRRTRNQPEFAWAHDLANMIFVSTISYCVGGAALSVAYFDGFLFLLAVTSCLREITAPAREVTFAERRAGVAPAVAEIDSSRRPASGWRRPHPGPALRVGVPGSRGPQDSGMDRSRPR